MSKTQEQVHRVFRQRLAAGLDPLTGEKSNAIGEITRRADGCYDAEGSPVTLTPRGTWVREVAHD